MIADKDVRLMCPDLLFNNSYVRNSDQEQPGISPPMHNTHHCITSFYFTKERSNEYERYNDQHHDQKKDHSVDDVKDLQWFE
jgi:hypothetical protein